jgi:hypothetical protein
MMEHPGIAVTEEIKRGKAETLNRRFLSTPKCRMQIVDMRAPLCDGRIEFTG